MDDFPKVLCSALIYGFNNQNHEENWIENSREVISVFMSLSICAIN